MLCRTLPSPVLKIYKNEGYTNSLDKLYYCLAVLIVKIFFPDTQCEGLLFHLMPVFSCPPSICLAEQHGFIFTVSSSWVLSRGPLLGLLPWMNELQFLLLTGQVLQLMFIFVALCSTQSILPPMPCFRRP